MKFIDKSKYGYGMIKVSSPFNNEYNKALKNDFIEIKRSYNKYCDIITLEGYSKYFDPKNKTCPLYNLSFQYDIVNGNHKIIKAEIIKY